MITSRGYPASRENIGSFQESLDFKLPTGFLDFFEAGDGGDINTDDAFVRIWSLNDMLQRNKDFRVEEYAPEFFLFGSNGGGEAYAIEKSTGGVYAVAFIVMSKADAILVNGTFNGFLEDPRIRYDLG